VEAVRLISSPARDEILLLRSFTFCCFAWETGFTILLSVVSTAADKPELSAAMRFWFAVMPLSYACVKARSAILKLIEVRKNALRIFIIVASKSHYSFCCSNMNSVVKRSRFTDLRKLSSEV